VRALRPEAGIEHLQSCCRRVGVFIQLIDQIEKDASTDRQRPCIISYESQYSDLRCQQLADLLSITLTACAVPTYVSRNQVNTLRLIVFLCISDYCSKCLDSGRVYVGSFYHSVFVSDVREVFERSYCRLGRGYSYFLRGSRLLNRM
jgi:hypothetical protein